ncbi:MAG: sodium ion-translocating decarboxylase subunit beta, partial [Clostridia bacterium]|nr:sodium ion-translocating decarboxylase subunit beta [Clostridia bacterium]
MEFVTSSLMGLWQTSGVFMFLADPMALIMVGIACVLLYLAIVKGFEPLLLLPIAFGMLLTNLLGSEVFHEELFAGGHVNWGLFGGAVMVDGNNLLDQAAYVVNQAGYILNANTNAVIGHFVNAITTDSATTLIPLTDALAQLAANGNAASVVMENAFLSEGAVYSEAGLLLSETGKTISGGLLDYLYLGVKLGIYPCLIFMGVGAGTDFGPLISNPKTLLLGAAAQLGIFMTFIAAVALGFTPAEASSIGIIGGADGPTAIWLTGKLAPHLLGPIAVAAYSYMALVPVIQPPIMRALTTKKEREIVMEQLKPATKTQK